MANSFLQDNQKSSTGIQYTPVEVPIPFAHHAVNINPMEAIGRQTDPNVVDMESITQRAAPQLRPEGSGRIMQQEYQGFLQAFPSIHNTFAGNQKIAAQLTQEHATAQAKANFYAGYLQQNKTLAGADQAWAQHGPAITSAVQTAAPQPAQHGGAPSGFHIVSVQ